MRRAPILLVAALALFGCQRRKGPSPEMKPAVDWQHNDDNGDPQMGDPNDPHAQLGPQDMGGDDTPNPHAGVDMGGGGDDTPNPHAGAEHGGGGDDTPNPHAGVDMGGGAGGDGPPIDPRKYLKGNITLTAATQGKVPAGAVIFLFAEAVDSSGKPLKPPLAVIRIDAGFQFPLAFSLDDSNRMQKKIPLDGKVALIARVDQDSDAAGSQPGDLSGMIITDVPADHLELPLDTVQP